VARERATCSVLGCEAPASVRVVDAYGRPVLLCGAHWCARERERLLPVIAAPRMAGCLATVGTAADPPASAFLQGTAAAAPPERGVAAGRGKP
jgi:hypothetical protein